MVVFFLYLGKSDVSKQRSCFYDAPRPYAINSFIKIVSDNFQG